MIPQEDLAGQHVLSALEPYRVENGGVLKMRQIHYTENRTVLLSKMAMETITTMVVMVVVVMVIRAM